MNNNYEERLINICKIILEQSNKYNIVNHQLSKTNKQEIFNVTNKFPDKISFSKRIKAISLDDLCICKNCDKIHGDIDSKGFCDQKCYLEYKSKNVITDEEHKEKRQLKFKKKYEGKILGYDYLICKECGFHGAELTTHVKMHGYTPEEYKSKYDVNSVKCQRLIDKVSGENNPGYQHGGKFSPFSENFIYADEIDRIQLFKQAAKSRSDNENETTRLSYWLKKTDGDIEEADRLLRERQSTFSLEKCIEKHGKEIGIKVWGDRQEKWLKSYNSKSKEELDEINKKKSNQLSYSFLWKNEATVDGIFYMLDINKGFYKIGITSRSIERRYKDKNYKILINFKSTINHCFQIEQILKKEYSNFGIMKVEEISEFGWTETFKGINLNEFLIRIEELKNQTYTTKLFKESFNLKYAENF